MYANSMKIFDYLSLFLLWDILDHFILFYFIFFEDEMQEKKFFAIFTILALKLAIA